MRKFFTIVLLIAITKGYAQTSHPFVLGFNGFKNYQDTTKDYLVEAVSGVSKGQLYKRSLLYFNALLTSANNSLSKVDSESITINIVVPKSVRRNSFNVFDLHFTLNMEFKDGRVKINHPDFELTNNYRGETQHLWLVRDNSFSGTDLGIYNSSGKLKSKSALDDLNNYFGFFIQEYIKALKKGNDW